VHSGMKRMIAHPPTRKNKRENIKSVRQLRSSILTELFSDQAFIRILFDFCQKLEWSWFREFSFGIVRTN
jgi:hypothetical protein